MEGNAYDQRLADIGERLYKAIEDKYPGLYFDTAIFMDWAEGHEKDLYTKQEACRRSLLQMMESGADIEQFRKKALEWGKTILKIYERYHAWSKAQVSRPAAAAISTPEPVAMAPIPPAPAPQLQQARLI